MRVILDTNIFVSMSFAHSGTFLTLRHAWRTGAFQVLLSEELYTEVARILEKPKIQKYVSDTRRERFLAELKLFTLPVTVHMPFPEAPDPNDAFLLAMIREGEADALVTGDKALLNLASWSGVPVISVVSFLKMLDGSSAESNE